LRQRASKTFTVTALPVVMICRQWLASMPYSTVGTCTNDKVVAL
jgi:hypothetical protein